jgi:plasma-membrane proton-efflux P-type ATPase
VPERSERGLTTADARAVLARDGANEVAEPPSHPLRRFGKKFWGVSAWMLELIAVLSFLLHKHADLAVVSALLIVNAILSFVQEQRASAAVAALRQQLQVSARVLRDARWQTIPARELVAGDVVRVRAGDFVPADLALSEGALQVDQSALTGESRAVDVAAGAAIHAGSVVRQGEGTGVVTATGTRTLFGRTTQLVQGAHPKLHVEQVIARVVRWLLVIVGVLVAVTTIASLVEGSRFVDILPISLVLLMSAIPVALPVMFTVSMAVGARELGRRGVLVTQLRAVEDAANMDVLCADKTGTLTQNRLALTGALPEPGFDDDDVVRAGALASNEANADPIDLAFVHAARERRVVEDAAKVVAFVPFSAATRRTEATIELGGHQVRVLKGALRTIAELAGLDAAATAALQQRADREAEHGTRALAVARADGDGPLRLVGLALLHDPPRPDSRQLIDELRSRGIAVKMLTGDALPVAREIGRGLDLGNIVRAPDLRGATEARAAELAAAADGFAEVFPEDKFLVVKSLQAAGHVVGMTGDGVNDAPALRQAEVGIAVRDATDVAKGAASAVLTSDGLGGIVDLVIHGRATYQRVLTWIVNKISRTILKAGFVVAAFLATGEFVISALGMVLLVFMTDFVKITLATDRVRSSPRPETWNIGPLIRVAVIVGVLMLGEALALLAFGWHRFELAADPGRLSTFTFQILLFFAVFSIVSVRERRAFWSSRPSTVLAIALAADALVGVAIGFHGLAELRPLPLGDSAIVFGYAAVCTLGINDVVKTILGRRAGRRALVSGAGGRVSAGS